MYVEHSLVRLRVAMCQYILKKGVVGETGGATWGPDVYLRWNRHLVYIPAYAGTEWTGRAGLFVKPELSLAAGPLWK